MDLPSWHILEEEDGHVYEAMRGEEGREYSQVALFLFRAGDAPNAGVQMRPCAAMHPLSLDFRMTSQQAWMLFFSHSCSVYEGLQHHAAGLVALYRVTSLRCPRMQHSKASCLGWDDGNLRVEVYVFQRVGRYDGVFFCEAG